MNQQDIDAINELLVGERKYDDYIMNNTTNSLGPSIIEQQGNASDMFSKTGNLISSSEFKPIIDNNNNKMFIFTQQTDNEIDDMTNDHNDSRKDRSINNHNSNLPSNYLTNNYIGQFYFASLTVVGLFILFRMIQKNK